MSLKIRDCRIEYGENVFTDRKNPRLTYYLESDKNETKQTAYQVRMQGWDSGRQVSEQQPYIILKGILAPFTHYDVELTVWDNHGDKTTAHTGFDTARLEDSWQPKWITDERIKTGKNQSPVPVVFRRHFFVKEKVKRVLIVSTAVGNYYLMCNGRRVSEDLLAPGYTSYANALQYQIYEITDYLSLSEENELTATVSGGWAAGLFGCYGKAGAFHDRQLFAAEIRIEYQDGTIEIIETDGKWQSATNGPYQLAGIYEGVCYDARINQEQMNWKGADKGQWKYQPKLYATYGILPKRGGKIYPVAQHSSLYGGTVYDFGQNCAAVVHLSVQRAEAGQKILVQHAEILDNGELLTANLSKARAEVEYICKAGEQDFIPELTYMGFRYIRVEGIKPADLEVWMEPVSSIHKPWGNFLCSDERVNQLQENIKWSGISNFVDIPTDCPQRDERMGWTGDIALFASTACFDFDMHRFLDKWLLDVLSEQGKRGDIGNVVPSGQVSGNVRGTAGWADCGTMVPWALYMKYADKELLKRHYPSMRKLMESEAYWSRFMSVGEKKYIWKGMGHLGDWLCPEGGMTDWGRMGVPIASAFFYNTCKITEETARILGDTEGANECRCLSEKVEAAFRSVYTDGKGKLKEEHQSAYAVTIYFGMLTEEERQAMGGHLARLVRQNDYKVGTGFLGTPFLLFALSDTGHLEEAYQMLLQEECPGWLYEPRVGATTIWECWDAVLPDGRINLNTGRPKFFKKPPEGEYDLNDRTLPGLSSLNHYAYGAVGDWLYRRAAGIEAIEPGYRRFRVAPLPGGNLKWVECETRCPYGQIKVRWEIIENRLHLEIQVPVSTTCEVMLPNSDVHIFQSGNYSLDTV